MQSLGEDLEKLCKGARQEITLITPFIKMATLKRLLEKVADDVIVKCVTRWRPEEIINGVSDIEIWLLLKERPKTSLWLRSDLHAKCYFADDVCLVGSANLTNAALGWSNQPNLELLISVPATQPKLLEFRQDLITGCIRVEDELFEYMRFLTEQFRTNQKSQTFLELETTNEEFSLPFEIEVVPSEMWIPSLRHPENLYTAYSGRWSELTSVSQLAAMSDLKALSVPRMMSKKDFETYVAFLLLQKPIIQHIDSFVRTSQRFGAVSEFLKHLPCARTPEFDADSAWQTLMRWMLYFLNGRYSLAVPNHSEVIIRNLDTFNPGKK